MMVLQKAPEWGMPCTLAIKAGQETSLTRGHAMQHWLTPPLETGRHLHGSRRVSNAS